MNLVPQITRADTTEQHKEQKDSNSKRTTYNNLRTQDNKQERRLAIKKTNTYDSTTRTTENKIYLTTKLTT
jgi:hypothetical protein